MKMKRILLAVFAALACVFLFSSCDDRFEISTMYKYSVGYDISAVGGDATLPTMGYFDALQWDQVETEDNDASSKSKAADQNDREALEEFEENFGKYNQASLYARYLAAGLESVTGKVTYTLTRLKNDYREEQVLRTKEIQINYRAQ